MSTERPKPSVQELLSVETWLDRSFLIGVIAVLAQLAWPLFLKGTAIDTGPLGMILYAGLALLVIAAYVGFAICVARAARAVGSPWLLFLAWVLGAPLFSIVLACVPIPLLGTAVLASPLSLKFLLSGQLRSEIEYRTLHDE
jgi:hypothetical protein